jgi:hypothetical protein
VKDLNATAVRIAAGSRNIIATANNTASYHLLSLSITAFHAGANKTWTASCRWRNLYLNVYANFKDRSLDAYIFVGRPA